MATPPDKTNNILMPQSMRKTKIVATISDRKCSPEFIRSLYYAGMNVVRMNTAHANADGIKKIISDVRAVSHHIGILIDTKGPEVRTTMCYEPIEFHRGEQTLIAGAPDDITTFDKVCVSYPKFAEDVEVGCHVLFDDGELDMLVTGKRDGALVVEVQNDGVLGSRKSVNVPGVHIDLPSVTERDKANIELAIDEDIDFIAHSFVRNKEDVMAVQRLLDARGSDIKIIAKIENQEGLDNIDEIIDACYGIMIARGDLGIEVPLESIPGIQRDIINKCIAAKKPVIVATQMLHTMIKNPRPTRAEVTDIANAIYYRTDALMLSGETANGKYPIEAVRTMSAIAEQAEKDRYHERTFDSPHDKDHFSIREFLSRSAIAATELLGVKGIITDSKTGRTARNLASFRGPNPVLAICYIEKVQRWLTLSYGVIAVAQSQQVSRQEQFIAALRMLRQKGYLGMDDKIAYLSGSFAEGGQTTFLEINTAKEVLNRNYQFHLTV